MKYILTSLALLLSYTAFSQISIDRSHVPAPGPAPQINIATPVNFTTANGIKVFVVQDHKVPKVTVSMILKKEPVKEEDKVGYVEMAGAMMRRGTATKTKAELDKEIDFLGGSIGTSSGSASASALTKNFDKIFNIFSDIVLHPAFRDSELVKVKKRTLSGLKNNQDDPSAIERNIVAVANYGKNHPYGEIETPETVKNITANDLKTYYKTFWKPNIAYMAFVGDITVEHAKALVNKYLGTWQKGTVTQPAYEAPRRPGQSLVYIADRPSAVQTNITITDPISFKPGSPEFFSAQLMNQILGGGMSGRLFQDLREKYGFTYGAYSSIRTNPLVGSFAASAAVRTAVTDSSLMRFMYELDRIKNSAVSQANLDSAKNVMSGNFALSLEQPSRIAQFAINIARYNMPKDFYKNYLKSIAAVSVNDIQKAAQQFITPQNANIILVGDAKAFGKKVAKYGKVQYVDNYGNPVKAPVHKDISGDVTAQSVINKYISAIGGTKKIAAVKDLLIKADAEIQGRKINAIQKYLLPDHYLMIVNMPDQNMMLTKTLVNGQEISVERMGQKMPLTDDKKAALRAQAHPFPITTFLDGKHKLDLTGIESVNGKEAYVLDVTPPNGKKSTYYFDTQTGLVLKQISKMKTPQGETSTQEIDFGPYKETGGLLFPTSMKTKTGPMTMDMTINEIKVNSGLSPEDFK